MTKRGIASTAFPLVAGILTGLRLVWSRRRRAELPLRGARVIITGGSRGLGLELARELARHGARLALLARDAEELQVAAAELRRVYGSTVLTVTCDLRDRAQVTRAVTTAIEQHGGVDVLVNNAGIIQVGPVEHMTIADFEEAMATHAWAPLYAILAVLPHMRRVRRGRIVNISSIGGRVAVPHLAPYCMSKFALTGLSETLRAELAPYNIRVTTVLPGLMRTGSQVQALLKGNHSAEMAWFSMAQATPLTSMSSRRAAERIVAACRRGEAELILGWQAKVATRVSALLPGVTAAILEEIGELLPRPTGPQGDQPRKGSDVPTSTAVARLSRLIDQAAHDNNELIAPAVMH